jgi:excisionase family DNA binding protein
MLTMAALVEAWELYFDPVLEFGRWLLYSARERGEGKVGVPATSIPRPVRDARVMTVRELSDYLRSHPSSIYRLLRRGELPGFRIGADWRFNVEDIDRWRLERKE